MALTVVPFVPQQRPVWDTLGPLRARVRGQLRVGFDFDVEDMSGVPGATMSYTEDGFAHDVVARLGLRLVGWPADIPFMNLSEIPGGVRPLLRLRTLWQNGTLRFERASAADIANAARDPRSLHPNPDPDALELAARILARRRRAAVVVFPAVLHPSTLAPLGEHPTSTQPGVDTLGARPRAQRSDIKKPRRRPVTNPTNKPLRRAKRGVTSARYVLEMRGGRLGGAASGGGGYRLTNDPIEEFRSPALTRMRQAARFGGGKVIGRAAF